MVIDRRVIDWDYNPIKDAPPKNDSCTCSSSKCPNVSRRVQLNTMTEEDCLAQGVKYFQDAMAISAQEAIKLRRRDEWSDMLEMWTDDPQQAATHMAFGVISRPKKESKTDGR